MRVREVTEYCDSFGPGECGLLQIESGPVGPESLVTLMGCIVCAAPESFTRAKSDMYVPMAVISYSAVSPVDLLVTGSAGTEVIRIANNRIEIRVRQGSRPPREVLLNSIVIGVGTTPIALQQRLGLAPSRYIITDAAVTISQVHNVVILAGTIVCPQDGSYRELSAVLPAELRPVSELEFVVPHGDSVALAKIFLDGRIVVETIGRGGSGGKYVSFHGVRFCLGESPAMTVTLNGQVKAVIGHPLTVRSDEGLCFVSGKLMLDAGHGDAPVFTVSENLRPKQKQQIPILDTLSPSSTGVVSIDVCGDVTISGSAASSLVRVLSLSGIVWPLCGSSAVTGTVCAAFIESLSPADKDVLVESIGEGISDYCARSKVKLDWAKFKAGVLSHRVSGDERVACGKWAQHLSQRYPQPTACKPSQWQEALSLSIAKQLVSRWRLKGLFPKLASLLVKDVPVEAEKVVSTTAAPNKWNRHAQMNLAEILRFNGRKCNHQLRLAKLASSEELAKLSEIVAWWNQWNSADKFLSHSSLMGNRDIFTDTGKWVIPDDPETQATLFAHMAWIYKRGYDTFISEIQTPLFPLIEDLDMESTLPMENTVAVDQMFLDEALLFVKERARALHVIYPTQREFTCYIYSSSGFNKSKGRWKSSFHLVWPDVIVNGELAPIIRQTTVEYFTYKSATSKYFQLMQQRLVRHYSANIWENVFDQTTSNANNGLRMPYCNKATWVKTSYGSLQPQVENRRCYPKGGLLISFEAKKFGSPEVELEARLRAMELIKAAEAAVTTSAMTDQNQLVGDRTQIKQSDKNTIHRTSAFVAGMRSMGGDLREFWNVSAEWLEQVDDPESLTEAEIAKWIQRGSCRRQHAVLSPYNEEFVDCYLKADLVWFEGHTLDSLRETEQYKKLTPAGQQGLKTRFKKYLQSKAGGGLAVNKPGLDALARLHELAQLVKKNRETSAAAKQSLAAAPSLWPDDEDDDETHSLAPACDEEDYFDLWGEVLGNLFAFHESMAFWKDAFSASLREAGIGRGYWINCPFALTWLSPRIDSGSDGFGSCITAFSQRGGSHARERVTVSLYFQCGKVLVSGNKDSVQYKDVLNVVKQIAKPDDRLYHKLVTPPPADLQELFTSFPLIDRASAKAQRDEFEQRWRIMETMTETSTDIDTA